MPPAGTDTLLDIPDQETRVALLGKASVENPLSLAVYFALLGSAGRPVKALGVPTIAVEGWEDTVDVIAAITAR